MKDSPQRPRRIAEEEPERKRETGVFAGPEKSLSRRNLCVLCVLSGERLFVRAMRTEPIPERRADACVRSPPGLGRVCSADRTIRELFETSRTSVSQRREIAGTSPDNRTLSGCSRRGAGQAVRDAALFRIVASIYADGVPVPSPGTRCLGQAPST